MMRTAAHLEGEALRPTSKEGTSLQQRKTISDAIMIVEAARLGCTIVAIRLNTGFPD
jgi:hypothetical protein